MLDRLISALVDSKNEAADDLLLEALALGNEQEKTVALDALLRRGTARGTGGVVDEFEELPQTLKLSVLESIKSMHTGLRECGRSDDHARRLAAMKLIALGHQGKLSYVLSENLHEPDEALSRAAVEAMVALARWLSTEVRTLQRPREQGTDGQQRFLEPAAVKAYNELIEQRGEIEQMVARALDVHRGKHGADLLRAALFLCDWPGSKTLAILHTAKHGGQSPMVRRLQQPPASEHVEAFLLGATHGGLRSHFGIVFSHINEAPVLDALLRKTHWLKDQQLQICMHQVNRGVWWGDGELTHDIERRDGREAARIGCWLAASGIHDAVQDQRLLKLYAHSRDDFAARLRLLRIAAARPRGASIELFKAVLGDTDERLARMAAREIVRRRPADYENILLQLMTAAPDSVRRVVARAIGQAGFEQFWTRFDRMDRSTRKAAGRAMLKILPDVVTRLSRRLAAGPLQQRIKALQVTQELDLAESLQPIILQLCQDTNSKLRSKAIMVLGHLPSPPSEILLDRVLHDVDPRVRANAIEVLETKPRLDYVPMLTARARSKQSSNRERANAIKALHRMKIGVASPQLLQMLKDERAEHRISAMWALKQVGIWQMLHEVGNIAKKDENIRVRRYALSVLRTVADLMAEKGSLGRAIA